MNRATVIGVVLLAATLAGWLVAPRMALASWLAAWWWAIGTVLGAFVNGWIHVLSGGAWGAPVRASALALGRRMPWLLIGLGVVTLGLHTLYPWASGSDWTQGLARPAFLRGWLTPDFFVARLATYAIAWWWLARAASFAGKGRAALSLVVYALSVSLAAVDLLMSLLPGWYSTAFGLIVMSTQALSGAAAAVLMTMFRTPGDPSPRGAVPVSRDLGNLLLMWCMTWGYLAFMQFLIIWAENLPREITWYVPRVQTGWRWLALALVLVQLAIPFLALLFRKVKDRPRRLAAVAVLLLAATALDAAWLVLPSVDPHDLSAWWLQPLAMGGMALFLFGSVRQGRRSPADGRVRHA
jgi:hypothetical protein